MQRKRHWSYRRILASDRAKVTLVPIAEKGCIKLGVWARYSPFKYYYLQFFVSDCLSLGLIQKYKRGWYLATGELYDFLRRYRIKYNEAYKYGGYAKTNV